MALIEITKNEKINSEYIIWYKIKILPKGKAPDKQLDELKIALVGQKQNLVIDAPLANLRIIQNKIDKAISKDSLHLVVNRLDLLRELLTMIWNKYTAR